MTRRFKLSVTGMILAMAAVAWPNPAWAAPAVNDPLYSRQYALARIGAPAAWKVAKGKGITIAIVDTGVYRVHEDLARNMATAQYDSVDKDSNATDIQGHGTAVASVAAGVTNNRLGIAGVAPSAKIMAVRAFKGPDGAAPRDIADAVMWAADHGAKVINLSLGAGVPVDPLLTDLEDLSILYAASKGVLVVAAAGNSAQPFCSDPAFSPGAICVGASDAGDRLARFSNYGARLDVVAPGVGIWSASRTYGIYGRYAPESGTSLASPIVAGVGALLMSMGATNYEAAAIIRTTAKDLGLPGYDLTFGFGRVDAKAAVQRCQQLC